MVDFYDLENLNSTAGIGGLLSLPNSIYPYFWAWILFGIWIIMTLTMFFREKERIGRGKLLASMSTSCFAIIILSVIGSIMGVIELVIFVPTLVISFIIIGIWLFTTN